MILMMINKAYIVSGLENGLLRTIAVPIDDGAGKRAAGRLIDRR